MAWQTPKTNWTAGDIPVADDFNRIERNIQDTDQKVGEVAQALTPHLADNTRHITSTERTTWNNKLDASVYTAADILAKLKTVDGSGSGLDADTLDGLHASAFSTVKIASGSYTGNGSSNRLISVGFQPKMAIVYGTYGNGDIEYISLGSDGFRHHKDSHSIHTDVLKLSNNGFTVGISINSSSYVYKYFAIG